MLWGPLRGSSTNACSSGSEPKSSLLSSAGPPPRALALRNWRLSRPPGHARGKITNKTIKVKDVNWIGDKEFEEIQKRKLNVRVRSTSMPAEALVISEDAKSASVTLKKAEEGIAPGQACVFYERDSTRVLGGGWITNS